MFLKIQKAFGLSAIVLAPNMALSAVLYVTDFEPSSVMPKVTSTMSISAGAATADIGPVGTIDTQGTATPSSAIRLDVKPRAGSVDWAAAAVAGPVTIDSSESDPRKVTFSFMASVSTLQPVTVRIESLDAAGAVTGGATAEVYPAAANFYQRYALELSSFRSDPEKPFNIKSGQARLSFGLRYEPGLPVSDNYELRIDNLAIATPSFYVSPSGDDSADGKTENSAVASPQKAIDLAMPGDIIVIKSGTYLATGDSFHFVRPGTPAGWIVLKNAPGEKPVLRTHGWTVIGIGEGSTDQTSQKPGIAYIEVRGITALGSNLVDATGGPVSPFPKLLGQVVPETNSSGISIDGRASKNPVHHIRIADCYADRNPGAGIGSCYADWLYFENNVTTDNAWFTSYACSGISILFGSAFDSTTGTYRFLVSGNRSSGNRCYQQWTAGNMAPHKLSDGNGIIIDTLSTVEDKSEPSYTGRTLVVNNVSFNNGGSGIHLVSSPNVDLVNNTTYLNSASTPDLHYGQMFAYRSSGCNFVNNILVAQEGEKYNLGEDYAEQGNTETLWSHTLLYGSNLKPKPGVSNLTANPQFVRPSRNPANADFTLRTGSPASNAGTRTAPVPVPLIDIDGHRRPLNKNPSIGASQP